MSMFPVGLLDELRDRLRRAELVEETCAEEGIDYSKPAKFIRATLTEIERLVALGDKVTAEEVTNAARALAHIRKNGWGGP